ncbi:hypothetical protein NLJ89_g9874 [Agrocybe chaxingu]|uniref:Uncharacterized protein n=1 Tax=Agrocybe chaxingu TaxID=84603 RepID=A0A9W8JPW8_9AGAR|nr:hypothetical protein NLJ89_g9874 [Agrocybe chaxingu]
MAGCCKGNPKATPPVPPTPKEEPCPHTPWCVNCKGDHPAFSSHCKYWDHRFDREWIMEEYRKTNGGGHPQRN